ncbi:MAG TPA: hypothetical protein PKC69_05670 [Chitinophagaceae bacterium]|nr:hypothetical protein [Chitinophagaceae bacterium]
MKKSLFAILAVLPVAAAAQFFYSDIIGTAQLNDRIKIYTANKVTAITATGYDARGNRSPDFNEMQEIDEKNRVLKAATRNGQTISRQYYYFDDRQRVIRIVDSATLQSTSEYRYEDDRLISISTITRDPASDFSKEEVRSWLYENGRPAKMWRVLNKVDSTEYRFLADEKGNIATEQLIRRGAVADEIFYYYNDMNLLTDVVRYDKKVKQLMPDFMFEYDEAGRLLQKTTILSTAAREYLIWRYVLNEKGLKTKEALFNKQKELNGRIDYAYTFRP